MGAQGPQFDADKTVRLHVVNDPGADNRLRFGPACRALDVSPSSTRSRRGARCLPSPSGFLNTPDRSLNDAGERGADGLSIWERSAKNSITSSRAITIHSQRIRVLRSIREKFPTAPSEPSPARPPTPQERRPARASRSGRPRRFKNAPQVGEFAATFDGEYSYYAMNRLNVLS